MDPSYTEKQIKHLHKDDLFVALSGVIVNKQEHSFVLDDGSGSAGIFYDAFDFEEGGYVRVFGRVLSLEKGVEVQADFVQDLRDIDKKIHKKVIQLLE